MNNETAIREELKELNSLLADVSGVLPYNVPADYFSSSEQRIVALVKNEDTTEHQLSAIGKAMPFSVPQGYFEALTNDVLAKVEAETVYAKTTPYELPENYFNTLPLKLLKAAKEHDKPKASIIPATKFVFKHLRLAAAAVLLICIGLGAYTTLFNNNYKSHDVLLRSVPQSEIEAYLGNADRNEGEEISAKHLAFENKDIVVYLNETGWE